MGRNNKRSNRQLQPAASQCIKGAGAKPQMAEDAGKERTEDGGRHHDEIPVRYHGSRGGRRDR